VLLGGVTLTIGSLRLAPAGPAPASPDGECDAVSSLAIRFCPSLPSFRPTEDPPIRLADQVRPCEEATAFRPSFCVTVPAASGPADHAALVSRRQDACAQLSPGDAPAFCLIVPSGATTDAALARESALALLRQRLGSEFRRVSGGELELWAESGVSSGDAERIDGVLRDDSAAVQTYFARRFRDVPAVFVFASQQSFAFALERQFGYSSGMAAQLSNQYGGLLVSAIGAIAINGKNVLNSGRPTIFRHELTHVMAHQIAGFGLPLWLDEGLATLATETDATAFDAGRATALSILGDEALRSTTFDEQRSWFDRNAALGGNAYGVAVEAVRLLVARLDRPGLVSMLDAVGGGAPLESAYAAASGESLRQFVDAVPGRALANCPRGISLSATRPDGLVLWRIYGFGPQRTVTMTADGPAHYAFQVQTDRYGVYSGTLGSPMPSGTYSLRATTGIAITAEMPVVVGNPTSSSRACGA
jgi:hypothetical protein